MLILLISITTSRITNYNIKSCMVYTNLHIFSHFYESKRWFSNVYITLLC